MSSIRVLAKVADKIVPVEFSWDIINPRSGLRGCSFTTDDVELQKALEAHEYFNRKMQPSFWTDDKEDVVVDAKEDVQDEPKKVKRYNKKG
jgi:hypothetical protein